jgi:biotin transport system substrate-specific component
MMQTLIATNNKTVALAGMSKTLPGRIVIGLSATLAVAAAAHVAVPLWFTPVPLTLQPLAVLGVGLALGPVGGFLAMLAYLAEGALGLPVFQPLGAGGTAQLFGPTGGFLLAYPLVAAIAGGLSRALQGRVPRFAGAMVACFAATVVLFVSGAGWLMSVAHLSGAQAWTAAVLPFLPGEAVKIVVASGVYSTLSGRRRIE